jgi:hypothetical protein
MDVWEGGRMEGWKPREARFCYRHSSVSQVRIISNKEPCGNWHFGALPACPLVQCAIGPGSSLKITVAEHQAFRKWRYGTASLFQSYPLTYRRYSLAVTFLRKGPVWPLGQRVPRRGLGRLFTSDWQLETEGRTGNGIVFRGNRASVSFCD